MIVRWTRPALDDVTAVVPDAMRTGLRQRLKLLQYAGQGLNCTDPRYPGAYYLKYRNWLAMYVEVAPGCVTVIGVEYNYGQTV